METDLYRDFWDMIAQVRADLTDDVYWRMVSNPDHRVPFLVR